jgi:GntR family transcriptional regulator
MKSDPSHPVSSVRGDIRSETDGSPHPNVVELAKASVVDHNSPVPYYFQLSSYIEAKVKNKEWTPGELLQSEQEICDQLGVSRTVVRQAMAELQRKGLISKQNGKRSMISWPKYEGGLMQTLRGFHEDALATGQKPSTRVLRLAELPAEAEVAAALQVREGHPVIMLDRLRSLDGEPEVLVETYIPKQLCPGLLNENFTNASLYELLASKYGLEIASGDRSIEAIALNRHDARLLGVKAGSPALLLRSIGLLADGTPLEYFIAKHRGDRSKFHVKLVSGSN